MSKPILDHLFSTCCLVRWSLFFDSTLDRIAEHPATPFVLTCRCLFSTWRRGFGCVRKVYHWWSQLNFEERGRTVSLEISLLTLEVPTVYLRQTIIGKILVIWMQEATLFRVKESNNTTSLDELIVVVFIIITINIDRKFGFYTWKIYLA